MNFLSEVSRKEGKTIILITHDRELVNYADRVVYIRDGKIEKIVKNKGLKKRMKGGRKNE